MKKQMTLMVLMITILAGVYAQEPAPKSELTPEQREEIKEIHDKYKPEFDKLRGEIEVLHEDQKILLSAEKIDEQAVYANIDKMGELKKQMAKQKLAMQTEKDKVAPGVCKPKGKGPHAKQGECKKGGPKEGKGKHGDYRLHGKHLEALNLSEEQKTEIEKIRTKHVEGINATREELKGLEMKSKSSSEKLASLDEVSALRTKLQKQKMAMLLERMEVLTPEQRQKMIEMRAEKGPRQGPYEGPRQGKGQKPGQGPKCNKRY